MRRYQKTWAPSIKFFLLFVTSTRPGHTCAWATTVVIIVVYEALDRDDSVANSFPDFSASTNRKSASGKKTRFCLQTSQWFHNQVNIKNVVVTAARIGAYLPFIFL
jgi:hypothetical protein